jgi:hypothetical protein
VSAAEHCRIAWQSLVPVLALGVALSGSAFGQSRENDRVVQFGQLTFLQTGRFGEDDCQNQIQEVSSSELG